MDKERIKELKEKMRNVMLSMPLTLKSNENCDSCGSKLSKTTNWLDFIHNTIELLSCCPICKKNNSDCIDGDVDLFIPKMQVKESLYKKIFMNTYNSIIRNLATDFTHAYGKIGDIESEPWRFLIEPYEDDENVQSFFDERAPFTYCIIEMYTSFELFLSELIQQKLAEWINNKRKYSSPSTPKKDNERTIQKIMERVNQEDKNVIVDVLEDEYDLTISNRIKLLGILGFKQQDLYDVYHQTKIIRNEIVHRGKSADFKDYANAFITIGKLFVKYGEFGGHLLNSNK